MYRMYAYIFPPYQPDTAPSNKILTSHLVTVQKWNLAYCSLGMFKFLTEPVTRDVIKGVGGWIAEYNMLHSRF